MHEVIEGEMLDSIDEKIISILMNDSRKTFTEIGKEINLAEGSVRERVKNLTKNDYIKKFTIETAWTGFGICLLNIEIGHQSNDLSNSISEQLSKNNINSKIFTLSGEYDLLVFILSDNVKKIKQALDLIRTVDGIEETNTSIILSDELDNR